MKQAVVPILSAADAEAIPNVISHLKRVQPETTLVIINPSAALDVADFAKEVDKQIADLEQAKKEASLREDFAAAQQFKDEIEEAKMNRATSIAQGIRKVPKAKLEEAVSTMAARFNGVSANVRHYTPSVDMDDFHQKFARLHEKFTFLATRNYSLIEPQSCNEMKIEQATRAEVIASPDSYVPRGPQQAVSPAPKAKTAPPASKPAVAAPATRESRKQDLLRWYMKLKNAAKEHGIDMTGRSKEAVAEDVVSREFPAAA